MVRSVFSILKLVCPFCPLVFSVQPPVYDGAVHTVVTSSLHEIMLLELVGFSRSGKKNSGEKHSAPSTLNTEFD